MHHLGTVTLRSERLTLRRHTIDDAAQMYEHWAHDPEVSRYLTWQPHANADVTVELLRQWVAAYERDSVYQWGIVLNATGELIGSISVVGIEERAKAVEIGYCLGRAWWNKGIMTEALERVIDFFFCQVGANRIWSCHDVANPASGAVMKKCGMRFEGVQRAGIYNNQGCPVDTVCYGIVAADWAASTRSDQLDRIARAEASLNRIQHANRLVDLAQAAHQHCVDDYELLNAYYGSADWKRDVADDNAGRLPANLRRGVLSEDGAYDALTDYERIERHRT